MSRKNDECCFEIIISFSILINVFCLYFVRELRTVWVESSGPVSHICALMISIFFSRNSVIQMKQSTW